MDPITDFLNRIRNAQAVFRPKVIIPFSNLKYEMAKILKREGFIEKVIKRGEKARKIIEITLKYQEKKPFISQLKRISRPGQRIYLRAKKIRPMKSKIAIISTPKGLMTDQEAKRKKLGGELICEIW